MYWERKGILPNSRESRRRREGRSEGVFFILKVQGVNERGKWSEKWPEEGESGQDEMRERGKERVNVRAMVGYNSRDLGE